MDYPIVDDIYNIINGLYNNQNNIDNVVNGSYLTNRENINDLYNLKNKIINNFNGIIEVNNDNYLIFRLNDIYIYMTWLIEDVKIKFIFKVSKKYNDLI
jgi:hypothetical protein